MLISLSRSSFFTDESLNWIHPPLNSVNESLNCIHPPVEADKFIVKLPQEIPQKKIAALRFVEAIDNLYRPVAEFVKDKQVDIGLRFDF